MSQDLPNDLQDFIPLYRHYKNKAPKEACIKKVQAWKLVFTDYKALYKFVALNLDDSMLNKMLWEKLNRNPAVHKLGISKSAIVDETVKFMKKVVSAQPFTNRPQCDPRTYSSRAAPAEPEVVNLSSDEDEVDETPRIPPIMDSMKGGDSKGITAAESFHEFFWEKLSLRVDTSDLRETFDRCMAVLAEAKLRSYGILALYGCDLEKRRDKSDDSKFKTIILSFLEKFDRQLLPPIRMNDLVQLIIEFCQTCNSQPFVTLGAMTSYMTIMRSLSASPSPPPPSLRFNLPMPVQAAPLLTEPVKSEVSHVDAQRPSKYIESSDRTVLADKKQNEASSDVSVSPEYSTVSGRLFRPSYSSQQKIKRSPPFSSPPTDHERRRSPSPYSVASSSRSHRSPPRRVRSPVRRSPPSRDRRLSSDRGRGSPSFSRKSPKREARSPVRGFRSTSRSFRSRSRERTRRSPSSSRSNRSRSPKCQLRRSPSPGSRSQSSRRGHSSLPRTTHNKKGGPRTPPPPYRRSGRSSISPVRSARAPQLDSREMGFGNSRGISQNDLRMFKNTYEKHTNIMDGVIEFAEVAKLDFPAWADCNCQKIVLDFLRFLDKSSYSLTDIKERAANSKDIKRMEDKLFDRRKHSSHFTSDLEIFQKFFTKCAEYAVTPYVSPYAKEAVSPKELLTQVDLFLDSVYGLYVERRDCPEEFFDFHEFLNFSRQVRNCRYLKHQPVQVANDFIAYLAENGFNMGELKKHRLANVNPTELPSSCKLLFGALQSATQEFFIHKDASVKFSAVVDCQKVKQDEGNGLHSLLEYIVKCLLEEAYMMMSFGELEHVAFTDVSISNLTKYVSKLTDKMIENGLTIYKVVEEFYQGSLTKFTMGISKNQDLLDCNTAQKLTSIWATSLVKRRPLLGPPNSHKMRDALKRRAFILIKTGTIVSTEVSMKVQCNISFPNIISSEMAQATFSSKGNIKEETEEVFSIENNSWASPLTKSEPMKHDPELFIESPGNVMITKKITIEGKRKVKCTATLCGIPRIRTLTPMKIWGNLDLYDNKLCRIFVCDDRLVCGNQLMISIGNISDETVTLDALTIVAHAMVSSVENPMALMAPLPKSIFCLKFLQHYFKTCQMTNVEEVDNGQSLQFGHGHQIKFNKKTKVNFKVTYSEVLNPQKGEFYTFDAIYFYLFNLGFNIDYKDYMAEALAARVPLVALRDTFNLVAYMKEEVHKCFQVMHKDKAPVDEFVEKTPIVRDDLLDKYDAMGFPIQEIVEAYQEQFSTITEDVSRLRLRNFLKILESMNLDPETIVSDALKAGNTREAYEKVVMSEIAKHYRANLDIFGECDPLFNEASCPIESPKPSSVEECNDTVKFIAFAEEFIPDAHAYISAVKRVGAKKERSSSLDLTQIRLGVERMMAENAPLGEQKQESLGLFVSANHTTLSFILFLMEEKGDVFGKIIKMGSRLLASCEKLDIAPLKYAAAIKFAVESCQSVFSPNSNLAIFSINKDTEDIFENPNNPNYMDTLASLTHDFIADLDGEGKKGSPSGFLLLSRPTEPFFANPDGYAHLYALGFTIRVYLSVMLSRRKKQAFDNRMMAKLLRMEESRAEKENKQPETEEGSMDEDTCKKPDNVDADKKPDNGLELAEVKEEVADTLTTIASSWSISKQLTPFSPLIRFVARSYRANGTDISTANFLSIQLATYLLANRLQYADISEAAGFGKLEEFIEENKIKAPDFIEDQATFVNLLLDHFSPAIELKLDDLNLRENEAEIAEDMDEDEQDESVRQGLEKFFDSLERGEDSRKISQEKIEQKLLFVPLKKHFSARLAGQQGSQKVCNDLVAVWIDCGCTPAKLKDVFEQNVLKGKKCVVGIFEELISKCKEESLPVEAQTLASWTYDFFMTRADSLSSELRSNAKHNDFRKKRLFQIQSDYIHMATFKSLRCFYEILMKFHFKEESAPEVAKLCVETWIILGFSHSQLESLFTCAVSHQKTLDQLLQKLTKMFDNASCLLPINARGTVRIDLKIMLEYTAMFFKTKALLGKRRLHMKKAATPSQYCEAWAQVRKNVLMMHSDKEEVYDIIETMLRKHHSPASLQFIMKEMEVLSQGTHLTAFKFSLQAHLLMGNFDHDMHIVLKDVLMLLQKITITPDESMEFEDGEILATTTEYDTDASLKISSSSRKAKKKKFILQIPVAGGSDCVEFYAVKVEGISVTFDLATILDHEYTTDGEHLWVDCNIKIQLSKLTCLSTSDEPPVNYSVETVLRFLEFAHLDHAAYEKECEARFPNLTTVSYASRVKLEELLKLGSITVDAVRYSDDDVMRTHKAKLSEMISPFKTELIEIRSMYPNRSYEKMLQSCYAHLFSEGMKCQRNWMAVASFIAEEMCDCWVNANFNYIDLVKPIQELSKVRGAARQKKIFAIYDNLVDGLVESAGLLPEGLRIYHFAKFSMLITCDSAPKLAQ